MGVNTHLRAVEGVAHGRDASKDLLGSLAKGLNDLVLEVKQHDALQGGLGSGAGGQTSNGLRQHWVAHNTSQSL